MTDNQLTNRITIKRLEEMEAYRDEGGKFTHGNAVELLRHAYAMMIVEANAMQREAKLREALIGLYNSVATERSTYMDMQGNYAHLDAMDRAAQALSSEYPDDA